MSQEVEVRRLIVRLMGNIDHYRKQLDSAVKLTANKASEIGKKVEGIGRAFNRAITVPLTAMAAVSLASFANFDKAMVESTSIMKATEGQMNAMRSTALALAGSGELSQGPKELAESYFFLASAGKNAEQSMKLLPTVSKFATAGAFDMALATDLLTDAQSALGLTSKDTAKDVAGLSRVADVLVKANTLANASVQQFSESLTNDAGAALRGLNKDVEEGVAVLAAYADQGIKGNVAGSMLGRAMRLLNSSAVENADAYQKAGVAVFDAQGNMRNMADIVEDLENHLGGMSDAQRTASLEQLGFAALAQKAITPLLGNSQAIKNYEKDLRNAGGTVDSVANKQMKSFSAQMKVTKNVVTVAAVEIGKVLAPSVQRLNLIIRAVTNRFIALTDSQKEAIVQVATITASFGSLIVMVGIFIKVMSKAVGVVRSFGLLMTILTNPIALTIAILAGLGAAIITVTGKWDQAIAGAKSFGSFLFGFLANAPENFSKLFDWISNNWRLVFEDMGEIMSRLAPTVGRVMGIIAKSILQILWVAIKTVGSLFKLLFTTDIVFWAFSGASKILGKFLGMAKDVSVAFAGALAGDGDAVKELERGLILENKLNAIRAKRGSNSALGILESAGAQISSIGTNAFEDMDFSADFDGFESKTLKSLQGVKFNLNTEGTALANVVDKIGQFTGDKVGGALNSVENLKKQTGEIVDSFKGIPELSNQFNGIDPSNLSPKASSEFKLNSEDKGLLKTDFGERTTIGFNPNRSEELQKETNSMLNNSNKLLGEISRKQSPDPVTFQTQPGV